MRRPGDDPAAHPFAPTAPGAPHLMSFHRVAAVPVLLGLGLLTVLPGCRPGEPAAPPPAATIALVVDRASAAGDEALSAARLALAVLDESTGAPWPALAGAAELRGLAGGGLELTVVDTGGDPAAVEPAMAEALARQPVSGFVIAEHAELVAIAGAYADRQSVPLVDGASSAGFLLEVGLDWYFRVTPSDRMLADAARDLVSAEGAGSAVLVRSAGTDPELAAIAAEFDRGQPQIIEEVTVAADQLGAAAVALAGTPTTPVIALAADPAEVELLRPVLASTGAGRVVVGLGRGFRVAAPAGVAYATAWSGEFAERHPLAREVADRYQRQQQAPMSELAAGVFTAVMALAQATAAADGADPAAVRVALRQLSVPATELIMPWRGLRFGDDGQNQLATAVVEQQTPAGPVLAYPPELAVTAPQWPGLAGVP